MATAHSYRVSVINADNKIKETDLENEKKNPIFEICFYFEKRINGAVLFGIQRIRKIV